MSKGVFCQGETSEPQQDWCRSKSTVLTSCGGEDDDDDDDADDDDDDAVPAQPCSPGYARELVA